MANSNPIPRAKVMQFPVNYKHIRIGDTCIFKATNPPKGWRENAEVHGKVIRSYIGCKDPHIIVSIDPTKHKMLSTLYVIWPKGHPEFNFYLKIKSTGLGSKLLRRAREERIAAFQGDLFPKFMA